MIMHREPLQTPKNNRQVQEYVDAVQRGLDSHFVLYTAQGWIVRKPKASRASGIFNTKAEAVAHAKKISSNQNTPLFVYNRDGSLAHSSHR